MKRVCVYIDGFNVFHAIKKAFWKKYFWLNYKQLAREYLQHWEILEQVYYFSAFFYSDAEGVERHKEYVRALQKKGIKIILGKYQERDAKFDKKEETKVEIIVNREKKYFLKLGNNIKEISGENIHNEILRLPKEMLENMTLTADEHLEYGYIVEIMSKLRNENVKNVSLNIQKNDK